MKGITLWQGHCLELMKNIPDGSVDLVLTDPPYGMAFKAIDEKRFMQELRAINPLNGLMDILLNVSAR